MARKKIEYPIIKKALWEAWRAFGDAFVAFLAVRLFQGVDLQDWRGWALNLIVGGLAAGFAGLAKWLRELKPMQYGNWIYKVPA